MVFIELITGKAGCGKSYMLSKYINVISSKTIHWVVLAYTHSAVKNIENYVKINYPNINTDNHFMTIHKYFHINFYDKDIKIVNNGWDKLQYMFIDEFSLISIYLFTSIWPMIKTNVNKLILCGDYRQLKPVNSSDKIYYDNLKKYLSYIQIDVNNIDIIRHFDNLILSLDIIKNNIKKVVNLNKQYRADNNVNNIIEILCFNNSNEETLKNTIDKYSVKLSSVINLIKNNKYVFIASTYKQLRKINELINEQNKINVVSIPIMISHDNNFDDSEKLNIKIGDNIRITETIDDFQNGELYVISDVYNDCLIVKNNSNILKQLYPIKKDDKIYYPILPEYLLTFHKSQGLSIDNVIVSIDNIFDFTMLYTGISRSRNNILFYTDEKTIDYNMFKTIYQNYSSLDILFNNFFYNVNEHYNN